MKTMFQYMKTYAGLYLFGLAAMVIALVLEMLAPQLTQRIIDDVLVGGNTGVLMPLLFSLLALGAGRAVFQYAKEFTYDCIGVKVGALMREDLFAHTQGLSMGFFDRHNTGELMTRVKDDIDRVWSVVGFVGILALEAVTVTVMGIVCMVRISPWLTLVPLAAVPLIAFCAARMENGLGSIYDQISEETAELNTVAQECIAGVRTVKAFAQEEGEIRKFEGHNRRFYSLNMKQAKLRAKYDPAISFLGKVMLFAIVTVGGLMVIAGRMTLGGLGAFLEYANSIIWPMECVGWLSNDIAAAVASWKKIRKVAAEEPELKEPETPKALPEVKGEIQFDHVSFSMGGREILKDISFRVCPGQTLGIMGMTGSGKTTIVNLLQRFYDVTEGKILLDGTDIRTIPLAQLRASIAVVLQEVFLFSDSVRENVRTGQREQIDADTVEWALSRADAARFVGKLEQESETVIGERGVGLSGGQKQRISIARALARKAPVLILDDATSALDLETEQLIQENLRKSGQATKLIIGHRISAVRHADKIIILEEGRIVERGRHQELMNLRGRYFDTWCVQYDTPKGGEALCQ